MREVEKPADAVREGEIQKAPPNAVAVDWWDDFARAVESPHVSTYDFLKNSILKSLELDGAQDMRGMLTKAQQKALKEVLALADLRELRDTIKKFEGNRLFFDYRTRVGIQCARVLLDTYISARDEYAEELAKRRAYGRRIPNEREQEREIHRIVEEKLGDPEVAESIEAVAEALTGKDKEQIRETVEKASTQLRQRATLYRIAGDVAGISRKYVTLDNAVNITIAALPLVTWQYRWALAAVLGAYVSRMAVYHGFHAAKSSLYDRDQGRAREEGHKALVALKAAGGNALAIGISPLVAKLPARFAIWGGFAASYVYNSALDIGQKVLGQKNLFSRETIKGAPGRGWSWLKGSFNQHADTLLMLAAKAARNEAPGKLTDNFEKASKKIYVARVRRVAGGVLDVSMAAGRRTGRAVSWAFNEAVRGTATGAQAVWDRRPWRAEPGERVAANENFNEAAEQVTGDEIQPCAEEPAPPQKLSL